MHTTDYITYVARAHASLQLCGTRYTECSCCLVQLKKKVSWNLVVMAMEFKGKDESFVSEWLTKQGFKAAVVRKKL